MIRNTLNTTLSSTVAPVPSPHSRMGVCDEGNPEAIKGNPDDFSVLSPVFYMKSESLRNSPAALNSPFGTAIAPGRKG